CRLTGLCREEAVTPGLLVAVRVQSQIVACAFYRARPQHRLPDETIRLRRFDRPARLGRPHVNGRVSGARQDPGSGVIEGKPGSFPPLVRVLRIRVPCGPEEDRFPLLADAHVPKTSSL